MGKNLPKSFHRWFDAPLRDVPMCMWQLCPAVERRHLQQQHLLGCCNLLSSFYYDSNWPTSSGGSGKVSFVFIFALVAIPNFTFWSLKKRTYPLYSPHAAQATHLRATAYDHDAGEDNGGVHATHLEAHQHTLSAAHAPGPDVHARPTGARAGLPGCDQAQGGAADDLRLLHGLESRDAAFGCVHETWVERNEASTANLP